MATMTREEIDFRMNRLGRAIRAEKDTWGVRDDAKIAEMEAELAELEELEQDLPQWTTNGYFTPREIAARRAEGLPVYQPWADYLEAKANGGRIY